MIQDVEITGESIAEVIVEEERNTVEVVSIQLGITGTWCSAFQDLKTQHPRDQALVDWRALREEQDIAYNESLMADKIKVFKIISLWIILTALTIGWRKGGVREKGPGRSCKKWGEAKRGLATRIW